MIFISVCPSLTDFWTNWWSLGRLWQQPIDLKGTRFIPHAALGFKSLNHCLVSQQQPFGLCSSAASQSAPQHQWHVRCLDNRGIKMGYGRIWDVIVRWHTAVVPGIAIVSGLWHRAAGITAQGMEVTPKEKGEQGEMLKFNCKVQSHRKALWNKGVAHRATCLSVKLVTCIQTLCYLQWVSFMLFNTENFLASCSENRLSLLCNPPWWVGAGISAAFPSACIHPPLQWFSNERHLFCNARHLHFSKCTWIYFGVQNYLISFGWIFISSVF